MVEGHCLENGQVFKEEGGVQPRQAGKPYTSRESPRLPTSIMWHSSASVGSATLKICLYIRRFLAVVEFSDAPFICQGSMVKALERVPCLIVCDPSWPPCSVHIESLTEREVGTKPFIIDVGPHHF